MISQITNAYNIKGNYEYSSIRGLEGGTMKGKIARYSDNKIVGMITDKDNTRPLFKEGFHRYLFGSFHSLGLSLIKFDSFETSQNPIYWAFEKEGNSYLGGWQPMRISPFAVKLKSIPSLQAVSEIEMDAELLEIFKIDFRRVLIPAREAGRIGKLNIREESIESLRRDLRI